MNGCIFCNTAEGRTGSEFLFEDDRVVAFRDISPQAPVHVLVIPRKHYASIKEMEDEALIGHMFTAAKSVAEKLGLSDYRLIINTGAQAGQTVFHIHLHLMGGRMMTWPPG
ncbi:MAG: histidine triad nucleotide-binding protein [bacterium]|nr:histidine triad nucleotide-binding protein [bacterium]